MNSYLKLNFFNSKLRKKYEIATDEVGNPIKQDTKKGQLREVSFWSMGLIYKGFFFKKISNRLYSIFPIHTVQEG